MSYYGSPVASVTVCDEPEYVVVAILCPLMVPEFCDDPEKIKTFEVTSYVRRKSLRSVFHTFDSRARDSSEAYHWIDDSCDAHMSLRCLHVCLLVGRALRIISTHFVPN